VGESSGLTLGMLYKECLGIGMGLCEY
jgi:hypothetical protein